MRAPINWRLAFFLTQKYDKSFRRTHQNLITSCHIFTSFTRLWKHSSFTNPITFLRFPWSLSPPQFKLGGGAWHLGVKHRLGSFHPPSGCLPAWPLIGSSPRTGLNSTCLLVCFDWGPVHKLVSVIWFFGRCRNCQIPSYYCIHLLQNPGSYIGLQFCNFHVCRNKLLRTTVQK